MYAICCRTRFTQGLENLRTLVPMRVFAIDWGVKEAEDRARPERALHGC